MTLAATILSALLALLAAQQPPGTPQLPSAGPQGDDRSGKGAVLCSWHFLAAAQQVAERCHPREDAELRGALRQSVADIDAFIVRNYRPQVTAGQVAATRNRGVDEHEQWVRSRGGDICRDPDLAQLYGAVREQGAAEIREQVAELLSVPRQPVMNPCF